MAPPLPAALQPIAASSLTFQTPQKRIQTTVDIAQFHASPAYKLLTTFVVHISTSLSPLDPTTSVLSPIEDFYTDAPTIEVSSAVQAIVDYIGRLDKLVDTVPLQSGPRRFGNTAFRTWLSQVSDDAAKHLTEHLPTCTHVAIDELKHYLLNSFGSGERLDYGTGHELSFAAFLCGVWVLGGFEAGRDEKALALRAFASYFRIIRRIVRHYSLEPAGSHGVWGLDDHAFLPYVFGSSQLTTFRSEEGHEAADGIARPADVVKMDVVNREKGRNLYFEAIAFIYEVKKGPFWEHSPILFDISGVQKGWMKINEGLLKMYDVEVLGKFPVVQHLYFGTLFPWSSDSAINASSSTPVDHPSSNTHTHSFQPSTRAPWATATTTMPPAINTATTPTSPITRAPWAAPHPPPFPTSAGLASSPPTVMPPPHHTPGATTSHPPPPAQLDGADTKAPWAITLPDAVSPIATRRRRASSISSTGTGGVRVAETGQLGSPRATASPHMPSSPHIGYPSHSPSRSRRTSGTIARDDFGDRPPWERMDEEAVEEVGNVKSEASFGGRRTRSPDSALAAAGGSPERRGSLGVGGVRVAETGDLSRRRLSRTG